MAMHEDYFAKNGCSKYTSKFNNENEANCIKLGLAFVWENGIQYGCLNPKCC